MTIISLVKHHLVETSEALAARRTGLAASSFKYMIKQLSL